MAFRTPSKRPEAVFGLSLMAVAMITIPVIDAIAKYLSSYLPPLEISFARFFILIFILAPIVVYRSGWRGMVPPQLWLHFLRGIGIAGATGFFFSALQSMPMADTAAVFFVEPLILTLFSAVFLGETIGWRRIMAVCVGFCGALIVIRPSFADVGYTALLPVGAAFCFAGYMTVTKMMAGKCDPWTLQFTAGVSGSLLLGGMMLAGMGGEGVRMPMLSELGLLIILAVIALICHTMIISALQRVEAASLAPFQYLEIIGATIWGYLVFQDFPDMMTWLGVAIIVGAGIYVFQRERLSDEQ